MNTIQLQNISKQSLGLIINTLYKLKEQEKINRCEFVCPIGYIQTTRFIGTTKSYGYDSRIEAVTYICDFLGVSFSIHTTKKEKSISDVTKHKQIKIKVPNIEKAIIAYKDSQYKQVTNMGDSELKSQIQQKNIFNSIINIVLDELQKSILNGIGLFEIYVEFDKIRTAHQELINFANVEYDKLPNHKVRDALASLILLKIYEALINNKSIKKIDEVTLTYDSNDDSGMYMQQSGYSVCRVRFEFEHETIEENHLKKWM